MLRFIKHNLTGIDGVEIRVMRMKKQEIAELSDLPLDRQESTLDQFINE